MIQEVGVTNDLGERLKMSLTKPLESGLLVASITGLGSADADISTTKQATGDGTYYTSSRLKERNVVLNLIAMETDTMDIEQVRKLTYRYFPTKRNVKLQFLTDHREVYCEGWVEKNEPTIFSSQESFQVSVICPDPYMYALSEQTTMFSGVDPMFEFPFSNESLTQDLLEMGSIRKQQVETITYEGECETGLTIEMHALENIDGRLYIYNLTNETQTVIDLHRIVTKTESSDGSETKQYGLLTGDDLVFCTEMGNKSLVRGHDGESESVISALVRPVTWFKLSNGENKFGFQILDDDNQMKQVDIDFSIINRVAYAGV